MKSIPELRQGCVSTTWNEDLSPLVEVGLKEIPQELSEYLKLLPLMRCTPRDTTVTTLNYERRQIFHTGTY